IDNARAALQFSLFDELLEARERRPRADLFANPRDEPLVEEQRAPLHQIPADAHLLLPELGFERPVCTMLCGVCVTGREALENEVADEIRCGERRPASVQRLEDFLRILGSAQTDRDELEAARQCVGERLRSA